MEFHVGDRVVVAYCYSSLHVKSGMTGKVIYVANDSESSLVEFDSPVVEGHNGHAEANYIGKPGYCWYLYNHNLNLDFLPTNLTELI